MENNKPKVPKKGAVKKIREWYEKNRGDASPELLDILKEPAKKKSEDKKTALPIQEKDLEL
jgi:hypothetical protein